MVVLHIVAFSFILGLRANLVQSQQCSVTSNGVPVPCQTCDESNLHCTSCYDGYNLDSNSLCVACKENCLTCNGTNSPCLTCIPAYGPDSTNIGTCQPCSTDHCEQICTESGAGKCDICSDGYGLAANKLCQACPAHCKTCGSKSLSWCDVCFGGYTVDETDGSCQACAPNCTKCDNAGPGKCDPDGCQAGTVFQDGVCIGTSETTLPMPISGSTTGSISGSTSSVSASPSTSNGQGSASTSNGQIGVSTSSGQGGGSTSSGQGGGSTSNEQGGSGASTSSGGGGSGGSSTESGGPQTGSPGSGGLSDGAVIGIILGVVLGLLALLLLWCLWIHFCRRKQEPVTYVQSPQQRYVMQKPRAPPVRYVSKVPSQQCNGYTCVDV